MLRGATSGTGHERHFSDDRRRSVDHPNADMKSRTVIDRNVPNSDIDLHPRTSICGFGRDYIVRRQGTPDALERELANRLYGHGILDCHQHTRTD
jgi:hypothetical protein